MSAPVQLQVEHLSVSYGAVAAVQDISIAVRKGECIAVIGANGAGKTSLLRGIGGLERCSSATRVKLGSTPLHGLAADKRARAGLGHVLEHRHVFPGLSVRENLEIVPRRGNAPVDAMLNRVLDLFPELRSNLDRRAGALSGGQQQFLAFGRAMMAEPGVLLLDEPTTGLAPILVQRIIESIQVLVREGTAVLLVEQALKVVEATAAEVSILSHGRIVDILKPGERSLADAAHAAYLS